MKRKNNFNIELNKNTKEAKILETPIITEQSTKIAEQAAKIAEQAAIIADLTTTIAEQIIIIQQSHYNNHIIINERNYARHLHNIALGERNNAHKEHKRVMAIIKSEVIISCNKFNTLKKELFSKKTELNYVNKQLEEILNLHN